MRDALEQQHLVERRPEGVPGADRRPFRRIEKRDRRRPGDGAAAFLKMAERGEQRSDVGLRLERQRLENARRSILQASRLSLQEFVVLRAVVAGEIGVLLHAAQNLVGEHGGVIDREQQQFEACELVGIAEILRVEDLLQRRHGRSKVRLERRDARLQLNGLGFAFGVAPILVLAGCGVLRRLDRTEERRNQVVLKGVILVGDEGDQMQAPIRRVGRRRSRTSDFMTA